MLGALFNPYEVIGDWLASPSAPAWVQAVGSVIAIVASVALVVWQHHLQRSRESERDVEQRRQRLLQLEALVDAAVMKFDFIYEIVDHEPVELLLPHARRELRSLHRLAVRFDTATLADKFTGAAWLSFTNSLEQAEEALTFEIEVLVASPDESRALLKTQVELLKLGTRHVKNMIHKRVERTSGDSQV